ncbi:MAG: nuclear transport factor 2 family protein [Chloroflexi bacterium]|nr:MAG: nuclear transport factor 2 family protein [Chloroflexota bacterium]
MDRDWAQSFVDEWVRAWNDHDVERVLEHFHDDAVFTSPVAALLVEGSGGVIRGRAALRHYWSEGLRRIPDLHFEVVGVYVGVRTVVINYRNQRGGMVSEVLTFDGELAVEGHGTYMGGGENPSGARTD